MLHKKRKPSTFTPSSGFADCKRNAASNNNMLHSKSTYFYRWFGSLRTGTYLVPTMCGITLLLGLGVMINPIANETDRVSAVTTNILTDSNLGTKVDLIMGDILNTSETVESGVVAYISNSFSVKVEGRADYHISVQAAEGYGSELTGRVNKEKISGVGNNIVPSKFSDNTWGYSLIFNGTIGGDVIAKDPTAEDTYSTLPAYGTLTTPTYSVTDARDQTDTYDLIFAAKITDYKPADHYETQALLSVVAEAKEIPSIAPVYNWSELEYMQQMTPEACAGGNETGKQLTDSRDNKLYWVAKLKDGNCWMTQNLALDLENGMTLRSVDTDLNSKSKWVVVGLSSGYHDAGQHYVYVASTETLQLCGGNDHTDIAECDAFSNAGTNMHYSVGNYYNYGTASVGHDVGNTASQDSICSRGWKLPTSSEYNGLVSGLTKETIRLAPYYFVAAGSYGSDGYGYLGREGVYRTANFGNSMSYVMVFGGYSSNNGEPRVSTNSVVWGNSVRCVNR